MTRVFVLCGLITSMAFLAGGCVYMTPGRGADLSTMVADKDAPAPTDATVAAALDKKPSAKLPATIAVVRIQSPGYDTDTAQGVGYGSFSVVIKPEPEDAAAIEQWEKLPQVQAVSPLTGILLSDNLQSDRDLRHAAAEIHADVLLVYTIDTTFTTDSQVGPMPLVTMGVASDRNIQVSSTASAVLMDTRNGYIYGVAEGTEARDGSTITWSSDASIDQARRATEERAFNRMSEQVDKIWADVVNRYQSPAN